jgi:hypothetical protein
MQEGTKGTALIWFVVSLTTLLLGTVIQLLLWWDDGRTAMEALLHRPALWGLYLLAGIFVGEHSRRLFVSGPETRG